MSDKPKTRRVTSSKEPVHLQVEKLKAIGLENIIDVEVYTITTLFDSVSHFIRFFGGGEVRISYNAKGEILEFSANNVTADIEEGERIVLKRNEGV